jgi:hypothetical protein
MNYQLHYDLLISSRKNRLLEEGVYYEKHHIIPKSMGGSNDPDNIIKLTLREHFIAHLLLWRIHRNRQMASAFVYMTGNMRKQNYVISSRMYEEVKLAASFSAKERLTGIPKTEEHKRNMALARERMSDEDKNKISKKISDALKGRPSKLKGRPMQDESKTKISNALKGKYLGKETWMKGKKHSEESKQKLREKAKLRTGEKNGFYGKTHSDETIEKIKKGRVGCVSSDETKKKLSELSKGTIWINNGTICKKIKPDVLEEMIPLGWVKGKIKRT